MPPKDAMQRLLDGLQMFIREHLALARAEVKADLRALGRNLAVGAAGVPALAVGYLLSMFAIAGLLALVVPTWAANAIVGLVNLAAGAALTAAGVRRATGNRVGTAEEIKRDRQWFASQRRNHPGRLSQEGSDA